MRQVSSALALALRRARALALGLLPKARPAVPTEASWAKRIDSYAAVPEPYKEFFEPLAAAEAPFPYTVLTPSYEGFMYGSTEKLVCHLGHQVCVLEKGADGFRPQCYAVEGISYVEVQVRLLDSRITINGVNQDGAPASTTCRFNTVTDYLLAPVLRTMRRAPGDGGSGDLEAEAGKFNDWIKLSHKFMNYARRSLLEGEKVVHAILQPGVRAKLLTILGKTFYRPISPTVACILTDRELIIIREETRHSGEDRYGGVWDYVWLSKVVSLSLNEKGRSLLVLSVQLPDGAGLQCQLEASATREVEQLIDRFKKLAPGQPVAWGSKTTG